jgi:hypothetical protein
MRGLGAAVGMIVTADLMLSLDNVMALAAVAQGQWLFLLAGLMLSIPLLMYGSLLISRLLGRYPVWVPAGSMLLGWLAGQLLVSDPLSVDWVGQQAPALTVVLPLLCALYAPLQARIIRRQRVGLTPPPPLGWLAGLGLCALGGAASTELVTVAPSDAAMPAPSVEPAAPQADPVAEPAPVPAAEPVRTKTKPRQDNRLPRHWQWLIALVAVVGVLAVGWIVLHLLSQGVLPTPDRPPQS